MIAVDANILVYAHRIDSQFFAPARECVRGLAEGSAPWAIPWPCLHEFYAIASHPRRYRPPSTPAQAAGQIDLWFGSPSLRLIGETGAHWQTLQPLLAEGKVTGAMVHDARIAAICIEHGVRELWTSDRDFSRFPRLPVRNPLVQ